MWVRIVEQRCSLVIESKRESLSIVVFVSLSGLVNLLLLVDTELTGAAVDQEQQTADNGQDLEEVVLGEVLVRVVLVELRRWISQLKKQSEGTQWDLQSRSCSPRG